MSKLKRWRKRLKLAFKIVFEILLALYSQGLL
jgi:hypothetical protein